MNTKDTNCSFTLVTVEEKTDPDEQIIAAKVFEPGNNGLYEKVKTKRPYLVQLEPISVARIYELSRFLIELEPHSHQYIVRGAILPDVKPTDLVRAIKRQHGRDTPTLTDTARRSALLDIDNVPCPDHIDPATDPEAAVDYILTQLPAPFRDCTFHWQFSGSQSIKLTDTPTPNMLKIHLWFWFDRPVSEKELKAYLKPFSIDGKPLFDLNMYSGNQPYFTANPVFLNGAKDPLPVRSGLRIGIFDEVALPAYVPPAQTKPVPRHKKYKHRATKSDFHNNRLHSALDHIPADDYKIWLMVGMALHASEYDDARGIWDRWSQTSTKFDPATQDKTWNSFSGSGVGIGTIFREARKDDWIDPAKHTLSPGIPPLNSERWLPVKVAQTKLTECLVEFFSNHTK